VEARYRCESQERRARLVAQGFLAADGVTPINAIDFVEVVDGVLDALVTPEDDPRQRLLLLRFLRPLAEDELDAGNVAITGGSTITRIRVRFALRLADLPIARPARLSPVAFAYLRARSTEIAADSHDALAMWLAIVVDQRGDHASYLLKLVASVSSSQTPTGYDPILSRVDFRFKIECLSGFDCEPAQVCTEAADAPPELDYLARDYQSFRRLMLDRLSVTLPAWEERSPADLGITLVELLAYAADQAAYFQDAVATEAYLNTARLRTSVRRHARSLDYRVHEGCNARAWVQLALRDGVVVTGTSHEPALPAGTRFLTAVRDFGTVLRSMDELAALEQQPEVYEALHSLRSLSHAHNEMHFHTWGESQCVLPAGSTSAALRARRPGDQLHLEPGDVIILEEVRDPQAGDDLRSDADPTRRHAVKLAEVSAKQTDLLFGAEYWEIRWHAQDAPASALCLWTRTDGLGAEPVTVARGNTVLVDHGRTRGKELLVEPESKVQRYRPRLQSEDLTWRSAYTHDRTRSARADVMQSAREALPAVQLETGDDRWLSVPDLLGSDPFAREFVVEMEADGRSYLRFGDGVAGRRPSELSSFRATYRTGNGVRGNVGAESIKHLVSEDLRAVVESVRNPLSARGGSEPETLQTVKLQAPAAFRVQMRAVTAEDWAEVAARHPDVQRAVATLRWTGSWYTVYLTVDPVAGRLMDASFERELRAFLEQFRLAGGDLELRPPVYVDLDLALVICVAPDHFAHEVKAAILDRLRSGLRADGGQGWFHADRFSFGQHVHLSPIVATVMSIPGVSWVDLDPVVNGSAAVRFQRLGRVSTGELEAGVISVGRLEVARLENDPSAPDKGRLQLTMRGGR
jgi:hypothetical protein